jgi:hypothetical protein
MQLLVWRHAFKEVEKRKDGLVHSSFVDHSGVPRRNNLKTMRFGFIHLACLLLLLSSLAVSDARAGSVTPSRAPGGVFERNMLLRVAVQEAEPARPYFGPEVSPVFAHVTMPMPPVMHWVPGPVAHSSHLHAVTGSSL